MSRTLRPTTRRPGRCRPRLERLETRLPLDASHAGLSLAASIALPISAPDTTAAPVSPNLSVVTTSPADGATLTAPPAGLVVTFDRPLDPWSLGSNDVVLQRKQGDVWVKVFGDQDAPAEALDATGVALTLTPGQPLPPGTYRLVLPEFSSLAGLDGSSVADRGADQVLAAFTVSRPGVTLADATDIGTPVLAPLSEPGSLDLAADPGAVAVYKFMLPAGHHWRFGAEVSARRDGSPLAPALALFDAAGTPIKTATTGRPDAPSDPYLFAGLDAGTYYLAVSGRGNLPDVPGGYDLVGGVRGSLPEPQPGGAFTLHVVADPADAPVRLLGSTVDHADPTSPEPTGLTLAFSGLLDVNTLRGDPSSGIVVVDQDGRSFPVTAVGVNEQAAQYRFLFDWPLPAGRYTVRVPDKSVGGATDLAGLTPVASGQPAGVLMTFRVAGVHRPHDPHDLGPLFVDVHQGVNRGDTIPAGGTVTYRFVTTTPGPYRLKLTATTGSTSVLLLGGGRIQTFPGGKPGQPQDVDVYLGTGVYYFRLLNTGRTPTTVRWTLSEQVSWDSLLDNGVGQGPALNLRMISPTSSDLVGTDAPPADPQTPSTPVGPGPATPLGPLALAGVAAAPAAAQAGHDTSTGGAVGASVAPSGLLLTLGNTLVGRPTALSEVPTAVGSATEGAAAAVSPGVAQGATAAAGRLTFGNRSDGELDAVGQPTSPAPIDGALVAEAVAGPAGADELVIAAADWLTRAGDAAGRWLALTPGEAPGSDAPAPAAAAIALARDDSPTEPTGGRVEQAQLGAPLAVGVASLLSLRLHEPFRRWLKRTVAGRGSRGPVAGSPALRGPHHRV